MDGRIYWGLDMGTSSLGWAVTDENYKLLRAKGKDMWGVRLFDEANTSEERRGYRTSRRRRQRQLARITFLKEAFQDEIEKLDPGFYIRLEESKFHYEDRSENNKQPFALFGDSSYTDKEYFAQYPTIFHLRRELLESSEAHDVRLVFLALLNMYKHRGNFLNDSLDTEGEVGDILSSYNNFVEVAEKFNIIFDREIDTERLIAILGEKGLSRSRVMENLSEFLGVRKSDKDKYELLNLMCGKAGKLINIYGEDVIDEEHKTLSLSFRDGSYQEKETDARSVLGDEYFELIEAVKEIHDIGYLANIMKGQAYLTYARVQDYEEHKKDLECLKRVLKRYDMNAYNEMFREMSAGSYSAYVGSVYSKDVRQRRGEKTSQEELYKKIKKIIGAFPQEDPDVIEIRQKIDGETFLPRQLTSSNGVIPNQVYVKEMKKILQNAENYLPFLKERDESGYTLSDRILAVFSFRIPYYVGPLGQEYLDKKGYNVWAPRIASGRIYPWNLEQKIDTKKAAEKFIQRMLRHCTYLTEETTLPKTSLLYEKFMVLNELNKLKVYGEPISVEVKQDIYKTLFCRGRKVRVSSLEKYFINNGLVKKDATNFLSGIDVTGDFKASLSSIGKFYGIFGDEVFNDENQGMIENIILWATIYGDDRKFVRERIKEQYADKLDDAAIKKISGMKFTGWGNLSREFLLLEGMSRKDGVTRTIINALWETNDNLMELLSDEYTYRENVESKIQNAEKELSEWTIEDLDGMYLSAPVKRMVWQTLKVLRELQDVQGKAPERIFVEMPREKGEKGVRKESRKKKLMELYASLRDEGKSWKDDIEGRSEADFRIKKLYLYYLQMGKCMYTGEDIDLDVLMHDNTSYDIDHIYPQHFVKDDSLDNNMVLVRKESNGRKSDVYPINKDIREKMEGHWKMLADKGFITRQKYQRLTRTTEFSQEELAEFICRQLVETRQGTKAITQILKQAFPSSEIVFSKAGEVSDFRKQFGMEKVRCVNDFHHAQDAYLNIVVGNTYYVKFTKNPLNFIREANGNYSGKYAYHMDKLFLYDVANQGETAWIAPDGKNKEEKTALESGTIKTVKKVLSRNTPLTCKRSYAAHGGITGKETIYGKDKAKGEGYIPVVSSDARLADVTKYGGRTSINNQCYVLVSYLVGGKKVLSLEALPVYLGRIEELDDRVILDYLYKVLQAENKKKAVTDIQIKIRCVRYNSLIKVDGFYYYLAGKTKKSVYLENAVPLKLSLREMGYVRKCDKALSTEYFDEKDKEGNAIISVSENIKLYDSILDKLTKTIYKNKKTSICDILQKGRPDFEELQKEKQVYVLMQIINWFSLNCISADLQLIKGSPDSGKCTLNKKISELKEAKLYDVSATGLFRREIDLLSL